MIRLDRILKLSDKEWRRVEYQRPSRAVARDVSDGVAAEIEWESIYDEPQKGLFLKGVETGSIVRVKRRVPRHLGGGFEVVARLRHKRLIEPAWPSPVVEAPMPEDLPSPPHFSRKKVKPECENKTETLPEVTCLEVALRYLRLIRMGHEPSKIAADQKAPLDSVEKMLVLALANTDVHALVRDGQVSVDVAIATVQEHGEKAGAVLRGCALAAGQIRRVRMVEDDLAHGAPKVEMPADGLIPVSIAGVQASRRAVPQDYHRKI